LNQSFKKTYNAFVACKWASGFGWNKAEGMVTASEDVWNGFLVVSSLVSDSNLPYEGSWAHSMISY
jgi:hypothetical protein